MGFSPKEGGHFHMERVGMLIGEFEFYPQRRPICARLEVYLTPKRYY